MNIVMGDKLMAPIFVLRRRALVVRLLAPLLLFLAGTTPLLGQSTGAIMVDSAPGTPGAVMALPRSYDAPPTPLSSASRAAAVTAVTTILKSGAPTALPGAPDMEIVGISAPSTFPGVLASDVNMADRMHTELTGCTALSPEDIGPGVIKPDRVYFLFRLVCPTLTDDAPVRLLAIGVKDNIVRSIYLNLTLIPVKADFPSSGGLLGDPEKRLYGGPWDGLRIGDVTRPNGKQQRGLIPAAPGASPLPETEARVVAAFLNAYRSGTVGRFKSTVALGPNNRACSAAGHLECTLLGDFDGLPFGEQTVPAAPYYLKASDRIRIEWVYKGMLYYISWLSVRNGKIVEIYTSPADIPWFF
jgi:hypothetical protein